MERDVGIFLAGMILGPFIIYAGCLLVGFNPFDEDDYEQ